MYSRARGYVPDVAAPTATGDFPSARTRALQYAFVCACLMLAPGGHIADELGLFLRAELLGNVLSRLLKVDLAEVRLGDFDLRQGCAWEGGHRYIQKG